MKKFLMFFAVLGFMSIPLNSAFAWEAQNLNPLPYVGIGPNYTTFSLNPFKGFKNCNPCKKVEVIECDPCMTGAAAPICPKCVKAFPNCTSCDEPIEMPQRIYVVEPQCNCMQNR